MSLFVDKLKFSELKKINFISINTNFLLLSRFPVTILCLWKALNPEVQQKWLAWLLAT